MFNNGKDVKDVVRTEGRFVLVLEDVVSQSQLVQIQSSQWCFQRVYIAFGVFLIYALCLILNASLELQSIDSKKQN